MRLKLGVKLVLARLLLYMRWSRHVSHRHLFNFFNVRWASTNRLVALEKHNSSAFVTGGKVVARVIELNRGDNISC